MWTFFSQELKSLLVTWVGLFIITLACRTALFLADGEGIQWLLLTSTVFASGYFLLFLVICRYPVWHLSLIWLYLPLLLFAIGWLRWYWAISLLAIWSVALWRTLKLETVTRWTPTYSQYAGLLLILVWIYFSGAGNYGNQSPDYVMHNGRLLDLIREPWPVHYSHGLFVQNPQYGTQHSYLVGYLGYYLPAALVGKVFGEGAAFEFIHFWTLIGCWFALLWLWRLVGNRIGFFAALALLLFGGWDIFGVVVAAVDEAQKTQVPVRWDLAGYFLKNVYQEPDYFDFWTENPFGYFFGNYLSSMASMYWSPNQAISAWACVGLLLYAIQKNHWNVIIYVYALLAFWSPMNVISLGIIFLCVLFYKGWAGLRLVLSIENLIAGVTIFLLLALYYFSGSAGGYNSLGFIWQKMDLFQRWWVFVVFHLLSWGVYAFIILTHWSQLSKSERYIVKSVFVSLFGLSLIYYGEYNDLLCRGSVSLQFVLLILILRSLKDNFFDRNKVKSGVAVLILLIGSLSAVIHIQRAWLYKDKKIQAESVVNYKFGWEFLGRTDSFFVKYLSKETQTMRMERVGRQQ